MEFEANPAINNICQCSTSVYAHVGFVLEVPNSDVQHPCRRCRVPDIHTVVYLLLSSNALQRVNEYILWRNPKNSRSNRVWFRPLSSIMLRRRLEHHHVKGWKGALDLFH